MSGLWTEAPSMADVVLAAIATPLVLASVLAAVTPLGFPLALGAGSLTASGGVGYALFLDPPASGS